MRRLFHRVLCVFFLGIFLPKIIFAAQISIDAKTQQILIDEIFKADLLINAEGEGLNAFEGVLYFPEELLDLQEIRSGDSIINFWIEKPKNQNGAIVFSGITPGGFNGRRGLILSAVFKAEKTGNVKFELGSARVLRNDGNGSAAVLALAPFEATISEKAGADIPTPSRLADQERPELFIPEIARDESIFDGKWFVVFATQDKASGLERYEIKESRQTFFSFFKEWLPAESPYILRDQELRSYVFVKAVDNYHNERIVKIAPWNPIAWYENYENWVMIGGALVALFLATFVLWKKRSSRNT